MGRSEGEIWWKKKRGRKILKDDTGGLSRSKEDKGET